MHVVSWEKDIPSDSSLFDYDTKIRAETHSKSFCSIEISGSSSARLTSQLTGKLEVQVELDKHASDVELSVGPVRLGGCSPLDPTTSSRRRRQRL